MNLYEVQDGDRPMYVVADSWQSALDMWKREIEIENGMKAGTFGGEMPEPDGIRLVCANTDITMPSLLLPNAGHEARRQSETETRRRSAVKKDVWRSEPLLEF